MPVAGRLVAILIGYMMAVLAAALFLGLLFISVIPLEGAPVDAYAGGLVVGTVVLAPLVGAASFFPALCAIALTEVFRLRDWLFHALGGGAVGLVAAVWLWATPERNPVPSDPGFLMALVGAGMVGGMAYWVIAGRTAGEWGAKRQRREE